MNCIDCPQHRVVADPDPTDSFCSDDEAVLCTLTPNTKGALYWARGVPFANRPVATSCRPYNKRKECATPDWCPLPKPAATAPEPAPAVPEPAPVTTKQGTTVFRVPTTGRTATREPNFREEPDPNDAWLAPQSDEPAAWMQKERGAVRELHHSSFILRPEKPELGSPRMFRVPTTRGPRTMTEADLKLWLTLGGYPIPTEADLAWLLA